MSGASRGEVIEVIYSCVGTRSCFRQQASQRVLSMAGATLLRTIRMAGACSRWE
jgi:hypothetical protein